MSRLKKCEYSNFLVYEDELAKYKSCRNCKYCCATQKVPCRQKFLWYFYQNDFADEFLARLGAKPRLRMIANCRVLLEKRFFRKVIKQAIAEHGYLPTRKQIRLDMELIYAM